MGLKHSKFKNFSFFFLIPLILSIGLASSISFFDLIQEAEGEKAVGPKGAKSYGSQTSSRVCGDRLCSETEPTAQASASTRITPSTPIPKQAGSTISVDGTNFSLSYSITGGNVLNVNPEDDVNSLIITIQSSVDGELSITLPRALIDAKLGNADNDFFVLVDGGEVAFGESKTATDRTLTIAFLDGAETIEIIGTFVVSPKPTGSTISVDGTNFSLSHSITGGRVLNVNPDAAANSLIITIQTTSNGELSIALPRALIDAKLGNADNDFFVIIDGEEVAFGESKTATDRTLTIAFPEGDETIEIIGTSVVPEFGTIAVMILGIAIISIIAVTARSKVIPRL